MQVHQYGIEINEEYLDLIQFLNDGVRLGVPEEKSYFIFRIHGVDANEITTLVKTEHELKYDPKGPLKNPTSFLFP